MEIRTSMLGSHLLSAMPSYDKPYSLWVFPEEPVHVPHQTKLFDTIMSRRRQYRSRSLAFQSRILMDCFQKWTRMDLCRTEMLRDRLFVALINFAGRLHVSDCTQLLTFISSVVNMSSSPSTFNLSRPAADAAWATMLYCIFANPTLVRHCVWNINKQCSRDFPMEWKHNEAMFNRLAGERIDSLLWL